MAAKSGAILSAQKLGYAKYLLKKRIKPFSGCPHLMRYSIILVSLLTGLGCVKTEGLVPPGLTPSSSEMPQMKR